MIIPWVATPYGPGWEDLDPEPIVWLEVEKVEASFALNIHHYVGRGGVGAGQPSRYVNIGRHFLSGRPIWMPHLGIGEHHHISFTDGRHRFAWIRDHGAIALPATTSLEDVVELGRRFGSSLRETSLLSPDRVQAAKPLSFRRDARLRAGEG
jgi:hypothetical protein